MALNTAGTSPLPLAGQIAVVSGASSGIGAAIARELSAKGASVVINYPFESEKDKAEHVLQSLKGPAKSIIIEADLSTVTGPTKLAAATAEVFGKIDILVNNAGLSVLSDLEDLDDEKLAELFDTVVGLNGRGTLLLTRAVLPYLSRHDSRIVNICSTTSRSPDPNMSVYAGSKGMVESFTRCWAKDLPRKYGCTVNAVAPGPVATESMRDAPPELRRLLQANFQNIPVASRMAEPHEIAWVVAMLCDRGAGWMNGLYVPVCGGSLLN